MEKKEEAGFQLAVDKKQRIKTEKEATEEGEYSRKEIGDRNGKVHLASFKRGFSDSIKEGSRGEAEQVGASKEPMEKKTKDMNQCKCAATKGKQ